MKVDGQYDRIFFCVVTENTQAPPMWVLKVAGTNPISQSILFPNTIPTSTFQNKIPVLCKPALFPSHNHLHFLWIFIVYTWQLACTHNVIFPCWWWTNPCENYRDRLDCDCVTLHEHYNNVAGHELRVTVLSSFFVFCLFKFNLYFAVWYFMYQAK